MVAASAGTGAPSYRPQAGAQVSRRAPRRYPSAGLSVAERAYSALAERFGSRDAVRERYRKRLEAEILELAKAGLLPKLELLLDLYNYASAAGIVIGPGRGAVAGSLVCYALGLTEIDPVRHGLIVERFLTSGRLEVEVEVARRTEMVEYLRRRYGNRNVAYLTEWTFESPGRRIIGFRRHESSVAVTVCEVGECLPVWWRGDTFQSQFAPEDAEAAGAAVVTLIGEPILSFLSRLNRAAAREEPELHLDREHGEDSKTAVLFQQTDTGGIPGFESEAMRDLLRRAKPASITDLSALYAAHMVGELERCHALAERMGRNARTRNSRNTHSDAYETPLSEAANHVVAETYGLMLYQERSSSSCIDSAGSSTG